MENSASKLIAFYGTLRKGESGFERLSLVNHLRFLSNCVIGGRLFNTGHWPALVPGEGEVVGELFEILDEQILPLIDKFEGYVPGDSFNSLFVRSEIRLLSPREEAIVYVFNVGQKTNRLENAQVISSGDWKNR